MTPQRRGTLRRVLRPLPRAAAGSEGARAGAGVYGVDAAHADVDYYRGIVVFTLAKGGLMYQATIAGQKYGYDPRR